MDFWEALRVLFNSSPILGPVAHLKAVYLAMHGNAGLCFLSLKMRAETQFCLAGVLVSQAVYSIWDYRALFSLTVLFISSAANAAVSSSPVNE